MMILAEGINDLTAYGPLAASVAIVMLFLKYMTTRDKLIDKIVARFEESNEKMVNAISGMSELMGENKVVLHQAKNALNEYNLKRKLQERMQPSSE